MVAADNTLTSKGKASRSSPPLRPLRYVDSGPPPGPDAFLRRFSDFGRRLPGEFILNIGSIDARDKGSKDRDAEGRPELSGDAVDSGTGAGIFDGTNAMTMSVSDSMPIPRSMIVRISSIGDRSDLPNR